MICQNFTQRTYSRELIIIGEIESVIKKPPNKENPR
jgi:hypothetical protein